MYVLYIILLVFAITDTFDGLRATSNILKVISEEKSYLVLKAIATSSATKRSRGKEQVTGVDDATILQQTKLSQSDYSEGLSSLVNAGIVTSRKAAKIAEGIESKTCPEYYALTELGRQVYDACRLVEDATNMVWKLKALDLAIEKTSKQRTSIQEVEKVIDSLIDNEELKQIPKRRLFSD